MDVLIRDYFPVFVLCLVGSRFLSISAKQTEFRRLLQVSKNVQFTNQHCLSSLLYKHDPNSTYNQCRDP